MPLEIGKQGEERGVEKPVIHFFIQQRKTPDEGFQHLARSCLNMPEAVRLKIVIRLDEV